MEKIIIFGIGDFAQLVHFYLTHDSIYDVVAFTANTDFIQEKELLNLPVVQFENIENSFPPDRYKMFVAIGYNNVNKNRAKKFIEIKSKGYELISYVSSKATTWTDIDIGTNCFIFENVTIQPAVKIGNGVIMWSGTIIAHHAVVEDYCFFAPNVVVSGNVRIKQYCFLGANATIRNGVTIAPECVIGAGTLILKDTKKGAVYAGKSTNIYSKKSSELKSI